MSKLEDFHEDDAVIHALIGRGKVSKIDDRGLVVDFEKVDEKIGAVRGIYNHRWFDLCGTLLNKL